jgi:hypothetical protein
MTRRVTIDGLVNALRNKLSDPEADDSAAVHAVPLVWYCGCEGPDGMVSHLVDERACPVCGARRPQT